MQIPLSSWADLQDNYLEPLSDLFNVHVAAIDALESFAANHQQRIAKFAKTNEHSSPTDRIVAGLAEYGVNKREEEALEQAVESTFIEYSRLRIDLRKHELRFWSSILIRVQHLPFFLNRVIKYREFPLTIDLIEATQSARNIVHSIKTLRHHLEDSLAFIRASNYRGNQPSTDITLSDQVYTCARIEAASYLANLHITVKNEVTTRGREPADLSLANLVYFQQFSESFVSLVANIESIIPLDGGLASA
jgi:hypothetical protein